MDRDASSCPNCHRSTRVAPTMNQLEAIVDAFLDGFWRFMGWTLAHLIFYAVAIAVLVTLFYFARLSH
jgi:hypothetical protein